MYSDAILPTCKSVHVQSLRKFRIYVFCQVERKVGLIITLQNDLIYAFYWVPVQYMYIDCMPPLVSANSYAAYDSKRVGLCRTNSK